jgi:HNH endonuclease
MNPLYPTVADRAAHRCEYCHAPELVFNFPFEIEHIIPICRSGDDAEFNLALACRSCNLRKGIRTTGIDPISKIEISFFNPRQSNWSEHFEIDSKSGHIQGKTPTGRVTITSLEMNSPLQITARQLWIRLGLFP